MQIIYKHYITHLIIVLTFKNTNHKLSYEKHFKDSNIKMLTYEGITGSGDYNNRMNCWLWEAILEAEI